MHCSLNYIGLHFCLLCRGFLEEGKKNKKTCSEEHESACKAEMMTTSSTDQEKLTMHCEWHRNHLPERYKGTLSVFKSP